MSQAEKRLAALRASLKYSTGADRAAIRAMIVEIECGFTDPVQTDVKYSAPIPERAAVVDPARKPPEALEVAVDGAGGASETNARQSDPADGRRSGARGEDDGQRQASAVGGDGSSPPNTETAARALYVPGTAGSLAPCSPPPAVQRRSDQRACQRCGRPLIGRWKAAAKYCVPCGNEVNRERRARAEAPKPEIEHRQSPLGRPRVALTWDPSIIIGPDRPALPPRRYTNGQPTRYQDDLAARTDHGSGGLLSQPTYRHSPTGCSSAMVMAGDSARATDPRRSLRGAA